MERRIVPSGGEWVKGAGVETTEHVVRACPNDPALAPASFESPERLPACGAL
jgi:hypothetical protein